MGRLLCAQIKADAYGHGAVNTARYCIDAGAKYLNVASLAEAMELREAGARVWGIQCCWPRWPVCRGTWAVGRGSRLLRDCVPRQAAPVCLARSVMIVVT